ncbi:hypothetical protein [Corallococcus aberystwythensis]|uniref:Glycosyltransferase RgtA/B/C/D-like domain-containing protein n=1 Tax=Corallococcus aberystwythensis TaxID=2316722 RepID=A0A3A8QLF6_9BACT|nr:hypothetical protein [Corallococcus aberystwythensis]RKH67780.1 hypothetical protein D7W81_13400 [Corallococcus aberystwythensis]
MTAPMTEPRALRWGLGVVLGVLALQASRLALHKAFSIDEFQYAHAAWLMAHGQVPYRDFFEVHFPLVYQVLAPLFRLLGDDPRNVLALRAVMLVPLAGACVSVFLLNRREGRIAALLAPVLLLCTPGFLHFATEVRPDALTAALFLGALAALAVHPGSVRSSFLAGALLVASAWGSQKALFFGGLVTAVLLADFLLRRNAPPTLIAAPRAFFVGIATATGLVAAYLSATGSWSAWWQWCFVWASEHQRHYPGFSWREYLVPALGKQPAFFVLSAVGLAATLPRLLKQPRTPDLLLVVAVPATFGAYALQRAPFPYSLLPFLGVLAPFAARGILEVLSRLRSPIGRTVGIAGLTGLLAVQAAQVEALLAGGGNARQREVLARIAELTGPEDVVYDNSGGYVSRPHAHFYFYTDAYLRGSLVGLLSDEMPRVLVERGCVLRVDDLRTAGLPLALRRFLDAHYQPHDGDLYLWGQRYRVPSGSGTLEDRFLAVRADRYFVQPASTLDTGALFIDGERITTPEFTLSRGEHALRYEGRAEAFQLLWLPRDAKRWTPRPGAPSHYSRLF